MPVGLGVRTNLTPSLALGIEVGARLTFFDYLDDVSGIYVPATAFADDATVLAKALAERSGELEGVRSGLYPAGSERGDSGDNDWFYVGSITLSYRLPEGVLRRAFARPPVFDRCYRF